MSALGVGATVVIFDGNPLYPTAGSLWEFAQVHHKTQSLNISFCDNMLHRMLVLHSSELVPGI